MATTQYMRGWRKRNPDKCQKHQRKYRHGLSDEKFQAMLKAQDGKCAICRLARFNSRSGTLEVDHCHTTLKIRKLLCPKCNTMIGGIEVNEEFLEAGLAYIKEHRNELALQETNGGTVNG